MAQGFQPDSCSTTATRCVLVPLVRLPSPVAQTFCTAPASRALGGRLFAYTGMLAPLLTQLRSPVPGLCAHAGLNVMLRREFLAAHDLTWSGEVSGNSCERARRAALKSKTSRFAPGRTFLRESVYHRMN